MPLQALHRRAYNNMCYLLIVLVQWLVMHRSRTYAATGRNAWFYFSLSSTAIRLDVSQRLPPIACTCA